MVFFFKLLTLEFTVHLCVQFYAIYGCTSSCSSNLFNRGSEVKNSTEIVLNQMPIGQAKKFGFGGFLV